VSDDNLITQFEQMLMVLEQFRLSDGLEVRSHVHGWVISLPNVASRAFLTRIPGGFGWSSKGAAQRRHQCADNALAEIRQFLFTQDAVRRLLP